jgi:hypothetical protein
MINTEAFDRSKNFNRISVGANTFTESSPLSADVILMSQFRLVIVVTSPVPQSIRIDSIVFFTISKPHDRELISKDQLIVTVGFEMSKIGERRLMIKSQYSEPISVSKFISAFILAVEFRFVFDPE